MTFSQVNAAITAWRGRRDARTFWLEHIVTGPLDRAQQVVIDRAHDACRHEPPLVVARQRRSGFAIELPRPVDLERQQLADVFGHDAGPEIGLGASETLKILAWECTSRPRSQIGRHVADDIGQLQRDAEIDRVVARLQIAIAENLDADQPDGRRHAQAVLPQLLERVVAVALQIHGDAVDQIFECRSRQFELRDERERAASLALSPARDLHRAGPPPRAIDASARRPDRPLPVRPRRHRRRGRNPTPQRWRCACRREARETSSRSLWRSPLMVSSRAADSPRSVATPTQRHTSDGASAMPERGSGHEHVVVHAARAGRGSACRRAT